MLSAEDVPAGSTILFILNQLGGALGIPVIAALLVGTGGVGEPAWTDADGTTLTLLPVLGCAAFVALAKRLAQSR